MAVFKHQERIVFVRKRPDAGRQRWRGRNDVNAHDGGPVQATLPHEAVLT